MSLILPDVVVESVIRDGIGIIRNNLAVNRVNGQLVLNEQFLSTDGHSVDTAAVGSLVLTLEGYQVTPDVSYTINPTGIINEQVAINTTTNLDIFLALTAGVGIANEFTIHAPADVTAGFAALTETLTLVPSTIGATNASNTSIQLTFTATSLLTSTEVAAIDAIISRGTYYIFLDLPGNRIIRPATDRLFDMIFNFSSLNALAGISGKYANEAERLKSILAKDDIAVVHSFNEVPARLPCISIQLASDDEDERIALNTDFGGVVMATGADFGRDENVVHANYSLMIGCHTKEPLLTKYIYTLVKYFLLDRKIFLEQNGLIVPSYRGSDFKRNLDYGGDQVYTRFLTMTGKTIDTWLNIDEVVANITNISLNTFVGKDITDIGNAGILVSNFGFQTNLFDADTPKIEISDPTYLTEFMDTAVSSVFQVGIYNHTNQQSGQILFDMASGTTPIGISISPSGLDLAALRTFIIDAINTSSRLTATATSGSDRLINISAVSPDQITAVRVTTTASLFLVPRDTPINTSNPFTLARLERNPNNPLETRYISNTITISSMETNADTGRTELTIGAGDIDGPWMPGSYVIPNTEGVSTAVSTENITFNPDQIVLGAVSDLSSSNGGIPTASFSVSDGDLFTLGDILSYRDISTGNTIRTGTVIRVSGNQLIVTDLDSTNFINGNDEIFQVQRITNTVAPIPGPTFRTRPDTISLGGLVTRVPGINVQTLNTGGTETYTDRSDATNNNPSPID